MLTLIFCVLAIWLMTTICVYFSAKLMKIGDISITRAFTAQFINLATMGVMVLLALFLNLFDNDLFMMLIGSVLSILIYSWILNISLSKSFFLTLFVGFSEGLLILLLVFSFGAILLGNKLNLHSFSNERASEEMLDHETISDRNSSILDD